MSCNRQRCQQAARPVPAGIIGGCQPGCAVQNTVVTGCGAPCTGALLEEMPVGMAYVPWQTFGTMYPMQQGMRRGTMFPCLDYDFMGRRCN